MPHVLLHTCCAPCASACVERLRDDGHVVTLFYANANIGTADEWALRLDSVRRLAALLDLPLLVEDRDHDAWQQAVAGQEAAPEGGARCRLCFRFNLCRAARQAREIGADHFATSLTISPHKDSDAIFAAGREADGERLLALDFKRRDGFARSVALARQYDLYRQRSCGCEFAPPAAPRPQRRVDLQRTIKVLAPG